MNCNRSVVFSGYADVSTNKTDSHDIAEILLKVALNTINQPTRKYKTCSTRQDFDCITLYVFFQLPQVIVKMNQQAPRNDFTTDIEQGIDLLLNSVPLLDLTDIKLK